MCVFKKKKITSNPRFAIDVVSTVVFHRPLFLIQIESETIRARQSSLY